VRCQWISVVYQYLTLFTFGKLLLIQFIRSTSKMTILEASSVLIEKTVERMSVTSLLLAASVFTLSVAYLRKLLCRQQLAGHGVSADDDYNTVMQTAVLCLQLLCVVQ